MFTIATFIFLIGLKKKVVFAAKRLSIARGVQIFALFFFYSVVRLLKISASYCFNNQWWLFLLCCPNYRSVYAKLIMSVHVGHTNHSTNDILREKSKVLTEVLERERVFFNPTTYILKLFYTQYYTLGK